MIAGVNRQQMLAATGKGLTALAVTVLLMVALFALYAPGIAAHSPTAQNLEARFLPPGSEGHRLGTDELGRDVFARVVYGSRASLAVGTVAVLLSVSVGLALGLTAALAGGLVEDAISVLADAILSFPTILLAITVVSVVQYGILQVGAAVGVVFTPVFVRLVRAETKAIREEGYYLSSRALGSSLMRTVALHVLPNILPRVVVQATITFALAIVIESSLAYLGLGTQPPNPSWGLMLRDARNALFHAPWLSVFPGMLLALTVFSLNFLGDRLAEFWGR